MSHTKIALDPHLRKLRDEGYDLEVRANHLLVHAMPYVTTAKEVAYGVLAMPLNMVGDDVRTAAQPHGQVLRRVPMRGRWQATTIVTGSDQEDWGSGPVTVHQMSGRPPEPDKNYYDKVTRYEHSLLPEPRVIKPDATVRLLAVKEMKADESVFHYADNGVARAGLRGDHATASNSKRSRSSGSAAPDSYILDLIAKTPVKEIPPL